MDPKVLKIQKTRYALVAALALSFMSVPATSQAGSEIVAVTVSTTHPNYNDQVTFTATGLTPGDLYSFGLTLDGSEAIQMDEAVVADATGKATDTLSWNADFAYKLYGGANSFAYYVSAITTGYYRSQVAVLDMSPAILGTSDYVYAGRDNKPGKVSFSGAGYQNGKFVPGEPLHISVSKVGGAGFGMLSINAIQSSGTTTETFWNNYFAEAPSASIAEVDVTDGAVETDITVPELPTGPLQIQIYWMGVDLQTNMLNDAGHSVYAENAFALPSNKFINSITQAKTSAIVDFTLPALAKGKYDRVHYSIDGGPWVAWGANAKSAQVIKGLKLGKTYSIRLRAHVQRGAWTSPSDPASITMNKLR
jgi:hypothetical protein